MRLFLKPYIRIGTSGWSYKHWQKFYQGMPSKEWLSLYAKHFAAVLRNCLFSFIIPNALNNFIFERVKAPKIDDHKVACIALILYRARLGCVKNSLHAR